MLTKTASFAVLEAQMARVGQGLVKDAHRAVFDYEPRPGYLYVRSRAISSRTNDNYDTFPAEEIKQAYRTFVGKPVFVNHSNANHRRARGVVIDAHLHEDVNPDGTPDTWCEVLMEVDAVRFPKLAQGILAGEIDRTSMGTDVAFSVCSYCGNKATTPLEYCAHIPKMKGKKAYRFTASGEKEAVLISEICYGLKFFENSLLVEPPADPTAFCLGVDARGLGVTASHNGTTSSNTTAAPMILLPSVWKPPPVPETLGSFQATLDVVSTAAEMGDQVEVTTDGREWKLGRILGGDGESFRMLASGGEYYRVAYDALVEARPYRGLHTEADDVAKHLSDKAALHEVSLAGHLVYEHNQPKALPGKKDGLIALHSRVHEDASYRYRRGEKLAYGEIVAPMQVDTLRDENCPVCGETDSYNGSECMVCGFRKPPDMFMDPNLEKAKSTDLRQDQSEDLSQVLDQSATLACDNCGETFEGAYQGAPAGVEDPSAAPAANQPPAVDQQAPAIEQGQQPVNENVNDPSTLPGVKPFPPDGTPKPPSTLQQPQKGQAPPVGKQPFQKLPTPKDQTDQADQGNQDQLQPGPDGPKPPTDKLREPERKPEDKPQDPTGQSPEDKGAPKPPGAQPEQQGKPDEKPEDQTDRDVVDTQDAKGGPDSDTAKGDATSPDVAPKEGDTCPTCGQGTLRRKEVSDAVAQTVDKEQDSKGPDDDKSDDDKDGKGDDNKPPWLKDKKAAALSGSTDLHRRDGDPQKEQSMRPALAALAEQQRIIERQAKIIGAQEDSLRHTEVAIVNIAKLAGLEKQAWIAELIQKRQARTALLKQADENNPAEPVPSPPSQGPAETTEQARQPDGTDNVMDVGASPVTDVAPDGSTSVTTVGGEVLNSDLNLNEEKVTAPVSGTEGPRPESETKIETDVQFKEPTTDNAFPLDPNWQTNSPVAEASRQNRMLAALRLARLRIQAGISTTADDLELATEIETSPISEEAIDGEIGTLSKVIQAQGQRQPQRVASRRLVPTPAQGAPRSTPSMAADVGPIRTTSASHGEDFAIFE